MPGLQVDLAVTFLVLGGHVVVGDQVSRLRERLEYSCVPVSTTVAPSGTRTGRIAYRPDMFPIIATAAQFGRDAKGIVPRLACLSS